MDQPFPVVVHSSVLKNQHTGRRAPEGAAMAGLSVLLLLTLALPLLLTLALPREQRAAVPDVRELLVAARGVAPVLCALAADGVSTGGWGGGWAAPATPIASDLRARLRSLRRAPLSPDEGQALVAGLAATDACERHLAATLLGRAEARSRAGDVGRRLASAAAPER